MDNIGTDIVYIPRLKKTIANNSHFINFVYTKNEVDIALKFQDPINFYATRYAAKEAIIKATNGLYDFRDIEILKDLDGKPIPKIINHDEYEIKLSLSFDQDYAIAFCIIQKK